MNCSESSLRQQIDGLKLPFEVSNELVQLTVGGGQTKEGIEEPRTEFAVPISSLAWKSSEESVRSFFDNSLGQNPQLNVQGFQSDLDTVLDANVSAYFWQIRQNNEVVVSGAKQWARFPVDDSASWTWRRRMHVASTSKFITAIAVVKALQGRNLDPQTTLISGFLPSYWNQGPGVGQLSFGHLLSHTSGIGSGGAAFSDARDSIESGVAPGSIGIYDYANANYAILRVLLGVVTEEIDRDFDWIDGFNDFLWNAITIAQYQNHVISELFDPIALAEASLKAGPRDALAYDMPQSLPGLESTDSYAKAGPIGWHLSAGQLNEIGHHFLNGQMGVNPTYMIQNRFGFERDAVTSDPSWRNPVFFVGGGWTLSAAGGAAQSVRNNLWFLHEQRTLSVMVNSPGGGDFDEMIRVAYLANT